MREPAFTIRQHSQLMLLKYFNWRFQEAKLIYGVWNNHQRWLEMEKKGEEIKKNGIPIHHNYLYIADFNVFACV